MTLGRPLESLESKFWRFVQKGPGCWEWTGGKFNRGYGMLTHRVAPGVPKEFRAHRVSWELHHGPIPDGKFVCHRCDNRKCVNPDHLFIGSNADNVADMISKGRQAKGTKNGHSKLSEQQIEEIRQSTKKQYELAEEYGVCAPTISKIKNYLRYK